MDSATQSAAAPLAAAPDEGRLRRPAPAETPPTSEERRTWLRALRSFYAGDESASASLACPSDDLLPAFLHPYRDPARVRIDYPLFIPAAGTGAEPGAEGPTTPLLSLADLLARQLEVIARGDDEARILKDNLARLERAVRDAIRDTDAPVDAASALATAGRVMSDALALRPGPAEALERDLDRLVEALPPGGRLLALGEDAAIHLFAAAAHEAGRARRKALLDEVRSARATLHDLMRLERSKDVTASSSDSLRDAMGSTGADRLDTEALARLLGTKRPASPIDRDFIEIIEHDGGVLDGFLAAGPSPLITVVGADVDPATTDMEVNWQAVEREDVCRAAAEVFDTQAASYAELFAALRTARLLAEGTYDPARHERLRATFDWRAFSRRELLALPPVVAIESAPHLAGRGMRECSRLLLSGRPVEIIVRVQPAMNPAAIDDTVTGYRFELSYLGISHREVLVHQSSAARPEHLVTGFRRSLEAATGSLHVVTSGLADDGIPARLGAWMHAGAALGGRAHPFIHYDPEAGATWARRLDLTGNPQPEADWPIHELSFEGAAGPLSVAFTFADFVLLEPRFRTHFRVVPDTLPDVELTPLADLLALPPDAETGAIPFIWAADERGCAHRLVVDRDLVRACRDRLDYWRTLQELAGIRNEHVREAVERETARLEESFAQERARLAEAHAAEIAQVREDEARAVLARLAHSLLGIDAASLAASVATAPPVPVDVPAADAPQPTAASASPATEAAAVPAPADEDVDEEPWIDSALCTSCNDCLAINAQVFVYNGNKQATIGDARAGTYAQLVQAAEKCPARCIHPGRPLNPDEPGLEALAERARPFNT